ncbi:hypothetical protein LguiB_026389 [Lonicera macranthoides]
MAKEQALHQQQLALFISSLVSALSNSSHPHSSTPIDSAAVSAELRQKTTPESFLSAAMGDHQFQACPQLSNVIQQTPVAESSLSVAPGTFSSLGGGSFAQNMMVTGDSCTHSLPPVSYRSLTLTPSPMNHNNHQTNQQVSYVPISIDSEENPQNRHCAIVYQTQRIPELSHASSLITSLEGGVLAASSQHFQEFSFNPQSKIQVSTPSSSRNLHILTDMHSSFLATQNYPTVSQNQNSSLTNVPSVLSAHWTVSETVKTDTPTITSTAIAQGSRTAFPLSHSHSLNSQVPRSVNPVSQLISPIMSQSASSNPTTKLC